MNIGNSTKLNDIPRLQKEWSRLKVTPFYGKIPVFLKQVELSVFLLQHGLRFEVGNDAIEVAQGIAQLNELRQGVIRRCTDLGIPIDI